MGRSKQYLAAAGHYSVNPVIYNRPLVQLRTKTMHIKTDSVTHATSTSDAPITWTPNMTIEYWLVSAESSRDRTNTREVLYLLSPLIAPNHQGT